MKSLVAFGPFGSFEFKNVDDGIAWSQIKAPGACSDGEFQTFPIGYQGWEMDELYRDADRRGHAISGFVRTEIGGTFFYTVK